MWRNTWRPGCEAGSVGFMNNCAGGALMLGIKREGRGEPARLSGCCRGAFALWRGLTPCLLLGVIVGASCIAEAAALAIRAHGNWTVEVVANGLRDACATYHRAQDGGLAIVAITDDSPFIVPVIELAIDFETIASGEAVYLDVGGVHQRAAIEVGYDDEGEFMAVRPPITAARDMLAAMLTADEIAVSVSGRTLARHDLTGFASAYADAYGSCGG